MTSRLKILIVGISLLDLDALSFITLQNDCHTQ